MTLTFYRKNLYNYSCVFFIPRSFSFIEHRTLQENDYENIELQKYLELKLKGTLVKVLYERNYKEDYLKGECFAYTTGLENFYVAYPKTKEISFFKGLNLNLTKFNNLSYKDFFFSLTLIFSEKI